MPCCQLESPVWVGSRNNLPALPECCLLLLRWHLTCLCKTGVSFFSSFAIFSNPDILCYNSWRAELQFSLFGTKQYLVPTMTPSKGLIESQDLEIPVGLLQDWPLQFVAGICLCCIQNSIVNNMLFTPAAEHLVQQEPNNLCCSSAP